MELLEKTRIFEKEHQCDVSEQPAFHLTPAVGWMNDPNGFSFYNGQIHLFYQYHPYSMKWGPMHWGHQTTTDLIVWDRKPCALAPEDAFDDMGVFSGSAIEVDGQHVLIYTGVTGKEENERQNQCLAIGDGENYRKLELNPVINGELMPEGFSRKDFRDPKLWKDHDTYYVLCGNKDENDQGQVVLFSSPDLKTWKYEKVFACSGGKVGKMWECPDFFTLENRPVLILSPQNMQAKQYEFHNGHNSVYFIGEEKEDGLHFETPVQLDYGLDFYAPQTTLLPDGRRILIAWMASWQAPMAGENQQWSSSMTLPRELSFDTHGRLLQKPVRELENWYKNSIHFDRKIIAQIPEEITGVRGRYCDFTIHFTDNNFDEFVIDLAAGDYNYTRFTLCPHMEYMEIDRTYSGMEEDYVSVRKATYPKEGVRNLRFILDSHSVEIFVNDGEMVLSIVIPYVKDSDKITFACSHEATIDLDFHSIDADAIRKARKTL